ncbi:hypothetical protein ACOSQ3_012970 [Xanthoceras sorbifolium]
MKAFWEVQSSLLQAPVIIPMYNFLKLVKLLSSFTKYSSLCMRDSVCSCLKHSLPFSILTKSVLSRSNPLSLCLSNLDIASGSSYQSPQHCYRLTICGVCLQFHTLCQPNPNFSSLNILVATSRIRLCTLHALTTSRACKADVQEAILQLQGQKLQVVTLRTFLQRPPQTLSNVQDKSPGSEMPFCRKKSMLTHWRVVAAPLPKVQLPMYRQAQEENDEGVCHLQYPRKGLEISMESTNTTQCTQLHVGCFWPDY